MRNTVETVAAVMSVLGPIADRLGAEATARGETEPTETYGADALTELAAMAAVDDLAETRDDVDLTIAGGRRRAPTQVEPRSGDLRRAGGTTPRCSSASTSTPCCGGPCELVG